MTQANPPSEDAFIGRNQYVVILITLCSFCSTDSGHSTMSTLRDIQDIESEYEPNSLEDDYPRKHRRISHKDFDSTCESEVGQQQN